MEKLYDIQDLCRILGITSRTLRFWEEKGLITSTTDGNSQRRKYSEEQVTAVKNVLVLRSLGIPVVKIAEFQKEKADLRDVIAEHRIELIGAISAKQAEINLLEEALHVIGRGGDIFDSGNPRFSLERNEEQFAIADKCTQALLSGDFQFLVQFFSTDMKHLLDSDALQYVWDMETRDLGAYKGRGETVRDQKFFNRVCTYLFFEKTCVCVRYVFHQNEICGFWINYTDRGEGSQ